MSKEYEQINNNVNWFRCIFIYDENYAKCIRIPYGIDTFEIFRETNAIIWNTSMFDYVNKAYIIFFI